MLARKPAPVIGILTGSSVSGNNSPKKIDFGGVGLGIVAALDCRSEIPANKMVISRNLSRSNPIPVSSTRNRGGESAEEMEMNRLEEYSIMKSHNRNKSKVCGDDGRKGDDRNPFRIQNDVVKSRRPSVFEISPVRFVESGGGFPPSDFLSSCNLCRKKLHDKDIYMYRGEKAFCSDECRYKEIVRDERREKCSSNSENSISRGIEVANAAQMFTTGILAI